MLFCGLQLLDLLLDLLMVLAVGFEKIQGAAKRGQRGLLLSLVLKDVAKVPQRLAPVPFWNGLKFVQIRSTG